MTMKNSRSDNHFQGAARPAAAELMERLNQFDGTTEQFLVNLLGVQCFLAQVDSGAVLRMDKEQGIAVVAIYPELKKGTTAPVWLAQAVELAKKTFDSTGTIVKPLHVADELYGQPAHRYLVMIPLKTADTVSGLAVFQVETSDPKLLETSRERLELTTELLGFYRIRLTLQRRQADLKRLQTAIETVSAVNSSGRFASVGMAFCNEVASKWHCERVSIGFLKGRYVQVKAVSHTEHFSRKMQVIQDIESAMEECLDQDIEILYPSEQEAVYISRSAGELSRRYGPSAILSLPLRRDGDALAVVTLERDCERPFSPEDVETARLMCELCTARLLDLYERARWVGAKAADGVRGVFAGLLGPKYTLSKIIVVLVFAGLIFLTFAKGQFRAEAPFVLEARHRQLAPAPFDGYLKCVNASVGDIVEADKTVLAELETAELVLQLKEAEADKLSYSKQADAAMRDFKTAQAQIAQANADKTKARIDLLEYRLKRAKITSPIGGVVVKGELERQVGAPVKTGDVLFEIALLENLLAELLVPEDQIADIHQGQNGYLATVSYPSQRIEFVVERVNPMAEVVNERNVFKVRVRLLSIHSWMRPGMEGVAKVSVGRRRYVWIWSHRVVNWLRMKFWF